MVVGQDALPGNTSRRLGVCTTRGTLLLECGAQLLGLLTLLVELGLKLIDVEGAAGGTTSWFACASAPPSALLLGALLFCSSARSAMKHSRVGSKSPSLESSEQVRQ